MKGLKFMIKMVDLPEKKRQNNYFVNAQEGHRAVGASYFEIPNPENTYFTYLLLKKEK